MRQSELFTKTQKAAPKDEESTNAKLLIQAGFIHKEMAGVYTYLPLGLRVLRNIERIIREEMNAIGGQELLMTTLQDPSLWKKSGRWSDKVIDNWFKSKLVGGGEIGIANTHEEPLVALLNHHVSSYRDLPLFIYQFQTKFRNELRAKSGIMRAREFLMKDLYSFSRSEEEFKEFYETCAQAYERIFTRVGVGDKTYRTAAAGGSFTTGLTDEFQTISSAGEDIIFVDKAKRLAVNKEVYTDEVVLSLGLKKQDLVEEKAVEVGNIFPLGSKYSQTLGLTYKNEKGEESPVIMGCYGIGLGRVMGVVVEVLSDKKGMVWPQSIAPFQVHLLSLPGGEKDAENLYQQLAHEGIEVLYDDRQSSPGEKLMDADLLGIPWRIVVSEKTVSEESVEVKKRDAEKAEFIKQKDLPRHNCLTR